MKKMKKIGRPTKRKIKKPKLKKAIEIVGSTTNLSLKLGIDHSLVSKWLYSDTKIPAEYVIKIIQITSGKIRPDELRPDIKWEIPPPPN